VLFGVQVAALNRVQAFCRVCASLRARSTNRSMTAKYFDAKFPTYCLFLVVELKKSWNNQDLFHLSNLKGIEFLNE
jgi:hypothetical protein